MKYISEKLVEMLLKKGKFTMKKKILSMLLVLTMIVTGSSAVFADSGDALAYTNDTLTESSDGSRSTSIPDKYYNLAKGGYQFSADSFRASLFTNYYFSPNENGELTVCANMSVGKRAVPTQLKIQILDLKKRNYVSGKSASNETKLTDDGTYGTYVAVKKTFKGLDPDRFYFVEISKTTDGEYAKSMGGYVEW